jgi:membrane protease YdiL (CAAX protease family)
MDSAGDEDGRLGTIRVVQFCLVTYTLTWACFIGAGLLPSANSGLRLPLLLLGSVAPSAVALAMTARFEGRGSVRELLSRLVHWRVPFRWYLFALLFYAAVKLLAAVIYRIAESRWPQFGGDAWYALLPAILVAAIVGGPLGEEVGWRGYALPRLTTRYGAALASLLVGLVWACWHLPLFFIAGLDDYTDQLGQSFPTYLLQVVALSVAIAYLMGNVGGSLLLAVLMHSSINQTKDIVTSRVPGADNMWVLSSSTVAWITVALLWICAAYFLFRMRRRPTQGP